MRIMIHGAWAMALLASSWTTVVLAQVPPPPQGASPSAPTAVAAGQSAIDPRVPAGRRMRDAGRIAARPNSIDRLSSGPLQ